MSKNIDFSKLGPYFHKNMVRIGTTTKIGQIAVEQVKKFLHASRVSTREFHARVSRAKKISAVMGHGPGISWRYGLGQLAALLGRRSERVNM